MITAHDRPARRSATAEQAGRDRMDRDLLIRRILDVRDALGDRPPPPGWDALLRTAYWMQGQEPAREWPR